MSDMSKTASHDEHIGEVHAQESEMSQSVHDPLAAYAHIDTSKLLRKVREPPSLGTIGYESQRRVPLTLPTC